MESLPDDLWRIVFAFSGPTTGARQVAARARTLDEYVEYRLASEPHLRDYYDSVTIEDGVANTRAHVKLVHALRTVSKQWRDIITYGSARQLTLKADSCVDLPPDFARVSRTASARRSRSEVDCNRDAPRVTADDGNLADPRASTNKVECGRGRRYSS